MNDIEKMCREHFNEPILHSLEVGRLIGYGEDVYDCCLIIKKADGSIMWHTAVGGYTFLRALKSQGIVPLKQRNDYNKDWNDFWRLDNILEINRCPKEKEFKVEITTDTRYN